MSDHRVEDVEVRLERITVDVGGGDADSRLWQAQAKFGDWVRQGGAAVPFTDVRSVAMLPSALGPKERFQYIGALRPPRWANR